MTMTIRIITASALAMAASVNAFTPSTSFSIQRRDVLNNPSTSSLNGYIAADATTEEFDSTASGLGFAADNVISIFGTVDKNGNAIAQEMKHYSKVSPLNDTSGIKIICKGDGAEIYQDPGLSSSKRITLAPLEAVGNALASVDAGVSTDGKIVISFVGGDDLMVHEVLSGIQQLVDGLDIKDPKKNVEFRSLSDSTFPIDKCGVVVTAGDSDAFYIGGQYYAVSDDDISTN
mmetsp:Transcript_9314/g.13920  ORF Transcript_9314/g.13920 Transcript_9314/m.13920 type:complete len:232 (+) Transcript_9314:100-795(+)